MNKFLGSVILFLCVLLAVTYVSAGRKRLEQFEDIVGFVLEEFEVLAAERGVEVRVVEIDGEKLAITKDLRNNRLNINVEHKNGRKIVSSLEGFF